MEPKILFYPEQPRRVNKAFHLIPKMGCQITADPRDDYRLAVFWSYKTVDRAGRRHFLQDVRQDAKVVNLDCFDVSKPRVDRIFADVAGYSIAANGEARIVEKSVDQCAKAISTIDSDQAPRAGFVRQRFIDTRREDGFFEDIRVPVFAGEIPFAWSKLKRSPFARPDKLKLHRSIHQILTNAELRLVRSFAEAFGADFAELDIIRDRTDGRIYVIDVNNIAGTLMAGNTLSDDDLAFMERTWIDAFFFAFGAALNA